MFVHLPLFRGQVVSEEVVGRQLDRLLGRNQQDVYGRTPVHAEVALRAVRLPEAIEHGPVHALAVRAHLLVLQARLHQVQREYARHTDNARNAAVNDLRQETVEDGFLIDKGLFICRILCIVKLMFLCTGHLLQSVTISRSNKKVDITADN